MPIHSSAGGAKFDTPYQLPPVGVHSAVCVDVIDEGMKPNPYKNDDGTDKPDQHKISIVWQLSKRMDNGKRFSIRQWFTNSLFSGNGKKSNLRAIVDTWGIVLTDEQNLGIEDFDLESLIGMPCLINVIHAPSKDKSKTYANVGSLMPLPEGMAAIAEEDYKRHAAKSNTKPVSDDLHNPNFDDNDSEIPF